MSKYRGGGGGAHPSIRWVPGKKLGPSRVHDKWPINHRPMSNRLPQLPLPSAVCLSLPTSQTRWPNRELSLDKNLGKTTAPTNLSSRVLFTLACSRVPSCPTSAFYSSHMSFFVPIFGTASPARKISQLRLLGRASGHFNVYPRVLINVNFPEMKKKKNHDGSQSLPRGELETCEHTATFFGLLLSYDDMYQQTGCKRNLAAVYTPRGSA